MLFGGGYDGYDMIYAVLMQPFDEQCDGGALVGATISQSHYETWKRQWPTKFHSSALLCVIVNIYRTLHQFHFRLPSTVTAASVRSSHSGK